MQRKKDGETITDLKTYKTNIMHGPCMDSGSNKTKDISSQLGKSELRRK
jgi:hypothetical protein